jgi:hypothetical protein
LYRARLPPVVSSDEPTASKLLVKGAHEGPPFSQDEAQAIVAWLASE